MRNAKLMEEDKMTQLSKTCKTCGAETRPVRLSPFSGQEASVTVTVTDMPAINCAKDHKRFLYPEFVARLMDLAADVQQVAPQPPAVKRGLFKKHYHCSSCDAELPALSFGKSKREIEVLLKDAEAFKLVVQVELHKCPKCGREQVLSNEKVAVNAFKAMAHGFRSADVHVDH